MHTSTYVYIRAFVMVCAVVVAAVMAAAVMTVTAQSAPAAPTGVQTVVGDTRVALFWSDPGNADITGYEYRQKIGSAAYGAWTAMSGSSATTTQHIFSGLTNGTVHKYEIRAKAGSTAGTASSELTVTPATDGTAPTLGTVTATSTDGTEVSNVRYLGTGDTVTVSVPVIDPNPPSTAPTVTIKFGASGTERTMTATGTHTLEYSSSSIVKTFPYTYTLQNDDVGTIRHKVTGVTDAAGTPNQLTDTTTFTEITAVTALTPVTDIGIQTASDSGADDNITNDTTAPVIEFTAISGATLTAQYRKAAAEGEAEPAWITAGVSATATGTAGTATLPNLTAGDGDYEVEITQQATGQQARAAVYTFILDTTDPTATVSVSPFFNPGLKPIKFSATGDVRVPTARSDRFGSGTAFSSDGNLFAVGSGNNDGGKGAVYLFENQEGSWTQTLKIFDKATATTTGELDVTLNAHDNFGTSVAFNADGTLLAVGADGVGYDNSQSNGGAVYLFEKSAGGTWSQTLKISDNDGGTGKLDVSLTGHNIFGTGVALSDDGTVLAVGAEGEESRGRYVVGGVYLFEKSGGTWSQTLLISDNGDGEGRLSVSLHAYNSFGRSVSISADGTVLAVGAVGETRVNGRTQHKGGIYLFEKSGGTWSQSFKIYDVPGTAGANELDIALLDSDYLGDSVALTADGTLLAAGIPGSGSGIVLLFEKKASGWSRVLTISDNNGRAGEIDVPLDSDDEFGNSAAFSGDGTYFAVGATLDDDNVGVQSIYNSNGAVYLFTETGTARSVSFTATDDEPHGSTWQYVATSGNTCGASQFTSVSPTYTEGSAVSFSAETDSGKRICFKITDTAGNISYALSGEPKPIDLSGPALTATVIGTGSSREYRVRAADPSQPVTGRTKDAVADASCTANVNTGAAGWTDYTPGEVVGTADDTDGRCVVVTDALGNRSKIHLSDGASLPQDFNLDLDASGTYEPNRDAILLYLYTNQGSSASELTTFTSAGTQLAVTSAIGKINAVKDQTNTPMDMDGNGTFTANTDGAIPYLHSGQGYDATALVPFTHDRQQTTAANSITRVRGTATPNWP